MGCPVALIPPAMLLDMQEVLTDYSGQEMSNESTGKSAKGKQSTKQLNGKPTTTTTTATATATTTGNRPYPTQAQNSPTTQTQNSHTQCLVMGIETIARWQLELSESDRDTIMKLIDNMAK